MMPAEEAKAAEWCYGYGCTGKNPAHTTCQNDAKTIGAMDVQGSGMLELRWSRSCNASWGRFSTYWLYDWTNSGGTGIVYARVTAWNPGRPSQDVTGQSIGVFGGASWWTAMVTGTTWSCTGVELYAQDKNTAYNDRYSLGWKWGPCVA